MSVDRLRHNQQIHEFSVEVDISDEVRADSAARTSWPSPPLLPRIVPSPPPNISFVPELLPLIVYLDLAAVWNSP